MSTQTARKNIKLEDVRLSYPNLFTPRSTTGDDGNAKTPEYSANFILDKKKHSKIIKQIEEEVKAVAIAKWGKVPVKFKTPLRDGGTVVDERDEPKDGYGPDVVSVSAKSRNRQMVVRRNPAEPADEDEVYAGCYVNAVINLYTWEHPSSGKGVGANLGPVQFVRNGERFGGSVVTATDAFEDITDSIDDI